MVAGLSHPERQQGNGSARILRLDQLPFGIGRRKRMIWDAGTWQNGLPANMCFWVGYEPYSSHSDIRQMRAEGDSLRRSPRHSEQSKADVLPHLHDAGCLERARPSSSLIL
jgi:hypothetical protein